MLKDHGNPVGRPCTDRFAVDEKPTAAEIGEARDAAQQRDLAAARGAHDAHDLVALDRKRQLMEGDDGAIEKELAGTIGDNGWIKDCFPGNHAFPRSRRRSTSPSGRRIKSPEKTCETQCEAWNSTPGARRRSGGAIKPLAKVVNARGSLWFGGELL
jgi:hypothetical protein